MSQPGRYVGERPGKEPTVGVCRWRPLRWAELVRGMGGEAREVNSGERVPPDGTEITPPRREEGELVLPALSDAVAGGAGEGRRGVCTRNSAHPRNLRGAPEQLTSARPAASSCGCCMSGCPNGCYFCSCLGFKAGLLCARGQGLLGPASLWVCSAQSNGEEPFKCSKYLWGHFLFSK